MKPLSEAKKSSIISLLRNGQSIRSISRLTHSSFSTIVRIRRAHSRSLNRARYGRPRILTQREERFLVRMFSTGQFLNAVQAQRELKNDYNIEISAQSIRDALKRNGMRARIRRKKPLLNDRHKKKRMKFARKTKNWTLSDWDKVVWSDESKFTVFGTGGRQYYWKRAGEALRSHHIKPTVKHGGGSVMVWGCMVAEGIGFLCRIQGNMDAALYQEILQDEFLETLKWYGLKKEEIQFQRDNDPKHTAKSTEKWLKKNKIKVLEWPPQSPDLNPMEHIWSELDRRIRNRSKLPTNQEELWKAMEEEWDQIEADFCRKLVDTMPARVNAVLKARGGYTKW